MKIVEWARAKCRPESWSKLFIAFGVCATFNLAHAQPAKSTENGWVRGLVVTDGAAVYGKADFDSPIQDYLSYQTQVFISKKPYAGAGGLGLFHRIRYRSKNGFITDTDIKILKKDIEKATQDEKKKSPSRAYNDDEEKALGKEPIYLTRYLGGALSMVNFTEKFSGKKFSSNMTMYGLRMTGPGVLFDGPPLDFNFWFSLSKPSYYDKFTTGSAKGFLLFGDVMAMLPVIDVDNTIVNFGLGVMYVYTNYSVPVKNAATNSVGSFSSSEFRMGVDFDLGLGQRFGKYLLRGDIKYYIEKTTYPGYVLSFQMEY